MISFQLSVPSKTFLLGEYVALHGGPAMLLTTAPRFQLLAALHHLNEPDINGINLASPAGKLIQSDADFYKTYNIKFIDPYDGLGGFGASSAQFLMVAVLKKYLQETEVNDKSLLEEYKRFAWDGEGLAPSGVDLIAQLRGGLCFSHQKIDQINTFVWPFFDLDYCLIHTNNKLATHLHLKEMTNLNVNELEKIAHEGLLSVEDQDSERFIAVINDYARRLNKENLVHENTKALLNDLSANKDILAAKGCGAMGADVVVVIYKRKLSETVLAWLNEKKLHIITNGNTVEEGLEFKTVINDDANK